MDLKDCDHKARPQHLRAFRMPTLPLIDSKRQMHHEVAERSLMQLGVQLRFSVHQMVQRSSWNSSRYIYQHTIYTVKYYVCKGCTEEVFTDSFFGDCASIEKVESESEGFPTKKYHPESLLFHHDFKLAPVGVRASWSAGKRRGH